MLFSDLLVPTIYQESCSRSTVDYLGQFMRAIQTRRDIRKSRSSMKNAHKNA